MKYEYINAATTNGWTIEQNPNIFTESVFMYHAGNGTPYYFPVWAVNEYHTEEQTPADVVAGMMNDYSIDGAAVDLHFEGVELDKALADCREIYNAMAALRDAWEDVADDEQIAKDAAEQDAPEDPAQVFTESDWRIIADALLDYRNKAQQAEAVLASIDAAPWNTMASAHIYDIFSRANAFTAGL